MFNQKQLPAAERIKTALERVKQGMEVQKYESGPPAAAKTLRREVIGAQPERPPFIDLARKCGRTGEGYASRAELVNGVYRYIGPVSVSELLARSFYRNHLKYQYGVGDEICAICGIRGPAFQCGTCGAMCCPGASLIPEGIGVCFCGHRGKLRIACCWQDAFYR